MKTHELLLAEGWVPAVFASECHALPDGDREILICPHRGIDCSVCACPGPTMAEYDYCEHDGVRYARPQP
jgi:hypothetical protein